MNVALVTPVRCVHRYSMPFEAVAVVIMLIATMFALIGHCNSDHKTLIACGLFTLGGMYQSVFNSFIFLN